MVWSIYVLYCVHWRKILDISLFCFVPYWSTTAFHFAVSTTSSLLVIAITMSRSNNNSNNNSEIVKYRFTEPNEHTDDDQRPVSRYLRYLDRCDPSKAMAAYQMMLMTGSPSISLLYLILLIPSCNSC